MNAGYLLSPAAQNDLSDIWDYSVRVWGTAQAEQYILSIRVACEALAEGRSEGRANDDVRPGYRKLAVGSHFLFYRCAESGEVDIVRILHQRMDSPGRLFEPEDKG